MLNEQETKANNDLKKILNEYYVAMREANFYDLRYLADFKRNYPNEYKFFNSVHCKRVKVNNCVSAMASLGRPVYFGTLTFNKTKDKNKRSTKRKEAFMKLNKLFRYVLLVEELGEEKGRYHIHFVGVYKDNYGFEDFKSLWHSRQNIELIKNGDKVGNYLVKYMTKQLPRVRRNKALIGLEREYKKGRRMDIAFPNCGLGIHEKVSAFDLLQDDEL